MNNKVPQQINDIVGDNVKKLAQLFPSAVKDGAVDFEALKEELGQFEEVGSEKYELTWAGKKNAKKIAQEDVIGRTLKFIPEDSKDADTTENLYIEGDNLEVLKLLRQNYYGAIKMIYIDPPYNTGNDFVYNDSFVMSQGESDVAEGNVDELGERFIVNMGSDNMYHAKWMNMMYSRLKVAKDLLSDDGAIFISIDNNEQSALKMMCDEIFGRNCFVSNIIWQKNYAPHNNVVGIPSMAEYILVYSKEPNWEPKYLPRTEEMDSLYKNPDNDASPWTSGDPCAPGAISHQGMVYGIQHPITGKIMYPSTGNCWRMEQNKLLEIMNEWAPYKLEELDDAAERARICNISEDTVRKGVKGIVLDCTEEQGCIMAKSRYKQGKWPILYFTQNGMGGMRRKRYLDGAKGRVATSLWLHEEVGHTDEAKKEVKNLFDGVAPFDTPKPTRLLERIITIATEDDSYVLDFFSGASSTVHAVFKKNLEDSGKRKFIMVQLPEKSKSAEYDNLCEVGKERIRRAGDKIKSEHPDADLDIGFKVFRTADTNIKWNSLMDMGQIDINKMETSPDTIDFMPGAKDVDIVYELMLRQNDVPLSSKIDQIFGGGYERTYLYADSYLVCLETKITNGLIDKLAEIDPLPIKFIFRDSAFQDDIALKDETFRRLKALIEKNHGMQKKTYTVEFL